MSDKELSDCEEELEKAIADARRYISAYNELKADADLMFAALTGSGSSNRLPAEMLARWKGKD